MSYKDREETKGVAKKGFEYLFSKPEKPEKQKKEQDGASDFLDMRTDISNSAVLNAIVFYRVLGSQFECKVASDTADLLERLAISNKRMGRLEAVEILRGQLPKEEVLLRGISESLKKSFEGEKFG